MFRLIDWLIDILFSLCVLYISFKNNNICGDNSVITQKEGVDK